MQEAQAAEGDCRAAEWHVGAPQDLGQHAAIGGGAGAASPGQAARDALWAVGRRLSSPFRERARVGAPDTAAARQGRRRSNWWFLLPIFLHVVGGIVAFFVLREDDVRRARNCLYLGLTLTALTLGPFVVLAAIAGAGAID